MKPQRGVVDFLARYPLACSIAAGALLLGALGYVQQGYELWLGGVEPWQLQGAFAVLFVTAVCMVLYRLYLDQGTALPTETPPAAAPAPHPPATHTTNITSHNQSGGITAAQVNVNRAPKPKFVLGQHSLKTNPDGTYTITCPFDVVAPYPPSSLYLAATSPGIKSLMVSLRGRSGVIMAAENGKLDGCCWTLLQQPLGPYRAQVVTASKQLTLEGEFR